MTNAFATSGPVFDYDPMIFDVLDETATRLRGYYMGKWHRSTDPAERAALIEAQLAVLGEVDNVDIADVRAVQAKTAELSRRLHTFEGLAL